MGRDIYGKEAFSRPYIWTWWHSSLSQVDWKYFDSGNVYYLAEVRKEIP